MSNRPWWLLPIYILALFGGIIGFAIFTGLFILFPNIVYGILSLINAATIAWSTYLVAMWFINTTPHIRVLTPDEQIRIEADQEAEEFFAELEADHAHKEIK